MKQHRLTVYFFAIAIIVLAASFVNGNKIIGTTKTVFQDSVFNPNTAGGWTIYSFYLNKNMTDSVEFELILKHNDNINWAKEQWIGTIKDDKLIPKTDQRLTYYLLANNSWNVRIAPNGKCFLHIKNGSVPTRSPVIIPIKVKYKNN
ncbi:MAG: hypothetical protein ABIN01_18455 [Ferruginibacter sp.]